MQNDEKRNQVLIRHNKAEIGLPLEDGNLKLTTLQQYFPGASGLTWKTRDRIHAVAFLDNYLIDLDATQVYDVHPADVTMSAHSMTNTNPKNSRVREILTEIRAASNKTSREQSTSGKTENTTVPKSRKKIMRTVHIGWMHKNAGTERFSQMKKPLGGIKSIQLNIHEDYSAEDLKNMAVKKFVADGNSGLLDNMSINLGYYDGRIINEFQKPDGSQCNFWHYCKSHDVSPYRLNLYLFTSPKDENTNSHVNEPETRSKENLESKKSLNKETSTLKPQGGSMVKEHEDTSSPILSTGRVQKRKYVEENIDYKKATTPNRTTGINSSLGTSAISNDLSLEDCNGSVEILYHYSVVSKYSNCESTCQLDKHSLYSILASELAVDIDEFDPIDYGFKISNVKARGQVLLDINWGEIPAKFSFPSFKSTIKPHTILYNVTEVNGMCDGSFGVGIIPSCTDICQPTVSWYRDGQLIKEGPFLYWITIPNNEAWNESHITCDLRCKVAVEIEPQKLFADLLSSTTDLISALTETPLNLSELTNNLVETTQTASTSSTTQPTVNLSMPMPVVATTTATTNLSDRSHGSTATASTANLTNRISVAEATTPTVELLDPMNNNNAVTVHEVTLPVVSREQIIFSKNILGVGSQGKVRQANWLGTEVAVKSIRITNAKLKFTSRELDLLAYIRHPNIIQTMGVCVDGNQLHILMELVDGQSLSDILFDEDIRIEYGLNVEMKNYVGKQICLAVNYLHMQNNPIIHRDIKPDNILVNKHHTVKLCDLGLSKFKIMATAIRSTIGVHRIKGTRIYMAPELLLDTGNATVQSDMWALACTLVELYNEESVWEFDEEDQENSLKEKLRLKCIPNISKIPDGIRDAVERCFSYEPEKRPSAADLLKEFVLNVV